MIVLASDKKNVGKKISKILKESGKEYIYCSKSIDLLSVLSADENIESIITDSSLLKRTLSMMKYFSIVDLIRNKPIVEIISEGTEKGERLNNMSIELGIDEVDSQLLVMIDDIIKYN